LKNNKIKKNPKICEINNIAVHLSKNNPDGTKELRIGSHKKRNWICRECGGDLCRIIEKAVLTILNDLPMICSRCKSLANPIYKSFANELDEKRTGKMADEISARANYKVYWRCQKCGYGSVSLFRTTPLAIKFIDPQHYLRFLTYSPYAVLFHIDNPLPLKYLYLGRDPLPAVRDYHRNAAMDTAPDAGILVMGQQYGGGIIVYRYDSETQELNKVWEEDRQ